MSTSIYYLPGHGGHIGTGLGEGLLNRGFDVAGRETVGEFRTLSFSDQIAIIAEDLTTYYWHDGAHVIANSFGAYLFLHAQALIAPFIGKVLLLSPIVGDFSSGENMMNFSPPQDGRLQQLAKAGTYPTPLNCKIHVGEQDWQSVPANVIALASHLDIDVTVVPNAGHMLGKDYVTKLLDRWLTRDV